MLYSDRFVYGRVRGNAHVCRVVSGAARYARQWISAGVLYGTGPVILLMPAEYAKCAYSNCIGPSGLCRSRDES